MSTSPSAKTTKAWTPWSFWVNELLHSSLLCRFPNGERPFFALPCRAGGNANVKNLRDISVGNGLCAVPLDCRRASICNVTCRGDHGSPAEIHRLSDLPEGQNNISPGGDRFCLGKICGRSMIAPTDRLFRHAKNAPAAAGAWIRMDLLLGGQVLLEPVLAGDEALDDVGDHIVTCGVEHGGGGIHQVT